MIHHKSKIGRYMIFKLILLLVGTNIYGNVKKSIIGNEIFYYIIVDRFYDGDKGNNIPKWAFPDPKKITKEKLKNLKKTGKLDLYKKEYSRSLKNNKWNREWLPHVFDKTGRKIQHYQGGDLEGVIKKLPYLKDLGITAIMLSPIFDNVNGVFFHNGHTSYHGYWTKDWYRLDEHFARIPGKDENVDDALRGTKLINELISKAHKLGLKVVLDLSLNHTSPVLLKEKINKVDSKKSYYNLEFSPIYKDGKFITQYCYPTTELFCDQRMSKDSWFNPSIPIDDWDDPSQLQNNQIHSLADLNQLDPNVYNYLMEAVKFWLKQGFDGFRIDAVKHIYPSFLKDIENELQKIKEDVILIGEYFGGGVGNDESISWMKNTDSYTMFDFSLAYWMRDFFRGVSDYDKRNTPSWLKEVTINQNKNEMRDIVTFINNHDLPRMISMDKSNFDSYFSSLAFMMISRGVPKLTYGDEIALGIDYKNIPPKDRAINPVDIGAAPWSRTMMDWDWYKSKTNDKYKRFSLTKKLIKLRKENLALRNGNTRYLKKHNLNLAGLFSYSYLAVEREDENSGNIVYYFYTRKSCKLRFKVNLRDGVYSDYINQENKYFVKNGIIDLRTMQKNSFVIISSDR